MLKAKFIELESNIQQEIPAHEIKTIQHNGDNILIENEDGIIFLTTKIDFIEENKEGVNMRMTTQQIQEVINQMVKDEVIEPEQANQAKYTKENGYELVLFYSFTYEGVKHYDAYQIGPITRNMGGYNWYGVCAISPELIENI